MNEVVVLRAEKRERLGTGGARELRKRGMVPAIIYGNEKQPLAVAVEGKEITRHYRKSGFISTVIELEVDKAKYKVLPKDVQLHPITDFVDHVDFVFLNEKIQKMEVPVVFEGKEKSIGVKRGGFFNIIKRRLTVTCPVNAIPKNITVDVTNMQVGQSIKVSQLVLPDGCEPVGKPDMLLASIIGNKGKAEADQEETAAAPASA